MLFEKSSKEYLTTLMWKRAYEVIVSISAFSPEKVWLRCWLLARTLDLGVNPSHLNLTMTSNLFPSDHQCSPTQNCFVLPPNSKIQLFESVWLPWQRKSFSWRGLAKIFLGFKVYNLITCELGVSEFWPMGTWHSHFPIKKHIWVGRYNNKFSPTL